MITEECINIINIVILFVFCFEIGLNFAHMLILNADSQSVPGESASVLALLAGFLNSASSML